MCEDPTNDQNREAQRDELAGLREQLGAMNRRVTELESHKRCLNTQLEELRGERQKLESRVSEYQALLNRNPATGLPIRRVFEAELSQALQDVSSRRRGPLLAVGLLRLDADYARIKNSRDRSRILLFKTADRIREIIGDNIYQSDRLDEFLLLFRTMPNVDGVELRADQIVEAVSRFHEPPADDVRFGSHLGVAIHPRDGTTREELLGNADIALAESERSRSRFVIYSGDMGDRYREREQIEIELGVAIQAGFEGFSLNYQPLVDRLGVIRGCEALMRWNHAQLGSIPPGRFIPVAEDIGAVRFLGQWSLYRACRQLKQWHQSGYPDLHVSVNLSPSQFKQVDLIERVGGILESVRLEARCLTLELTETTVMEEPEEAVAKMNELRSMGVRLALDDFGTGYSSLSYLRRFQFDTLKIDRSFVTSVHQSRNDQEIVRALIAMARAFGMKTLAEGVEEREALDFLLESGCDYVQGYHFSPAVPEDRFAALLSTGFPVT